MALNRGSIVGYNADRMMFEFTMNTPDEKKSPTAQASTGYRGQASGARG
jgi:hypothetical protein